MLKKSQTIKLSNLSSLKKSLMSIDVVIPTLLFLGVLAVYTHNLSPSIYGYDSGDYASAIIAKGVPHPSGYPLYTMLGILFNLLPFQTPAWRIGLVSVFSSAFAVFLSYFIILELLRNRMAALFGALSIAFFYPFWLYAEVVEVLSLNSFFVLLLLFLTIKFHKTKKVFFAYLLSFSAGLSLTNNEVIILLFPAVSIVFLSNWKQILKPKIILLCILFFILGLLPYIYIPIAASFHPIINTGNGSTIKSFLDIVLRRYYGWGTNSPAPFNYNLINIYLTFIIKETGIVFLLVSFVGVVFLAYKRELTALFILLLGIILTGPFFFVYSRTGLFGFFQLGLLERFIISSYILFAILFSIGLYLIASLINKSLQFLLSKVNPKTSKRSFLFVILLIFFLYPVKLFSSHSISTDFHNVWIGDNLAKDILNSLPKNSVAIVSNDTAVFNIRYIQLAENIREDVFVPVHFSDFRDYAIKKGFISKQNSFNKEGKGLKIKEADSLLKILSSIKSSIPVYFLYIPQYNQDKLKEIKFIPYGFLFKLEDDKDLRPTKEEYIKQQENLLGKTHAQDFARYKSLIATNYNFISIFSLYFEAYLNKWEYLSSHYNDSVSGKIFLDKATEIKPMSNNYPTQ